MTDKPKSNARIARDAAFLPIGPDSETWKIFGEYRYSLVLPQAFVLQVAHPIIDAGVGEHSTYRTDPWGRARRSLELLWPVVYARPQDAIRKGIELRELHRSIRGKLADGRQYNALNPEAYGWVHGTGFYSSVTLLEQFGNGCDIARRARLFSEWRQMAGMLGIREQDLPRTEAEYWDYFNDMIDNRLQWGPVVADLMGDDFFYSHPKPPADVFRFLPAPLWRLGIRPVAWSFELITRATLPARFRERFDIPFSARDQQHFDRLRKAIRLGWQLTPRDRRYLPLARDAWRDARTHPEAYHYSADDIPNMLAAVAG